MDNGRFHSDESPTESATVTTELTLEQVRVLLRRLLALVADRVQREQSVEKHHVAAVLNDQRQHDEVLNQLTLAYHSEMASLQQDQGTQQVELESRWRAEAETVADEYRRATVEVDSLHAEETGLALREFDEATWLVGSLLDDDTDDSPLTRLQALQSGALASRTELQTALTSITGWCKHSTEYLKRSRLLSRFEAPTASDLPADAEKLHRLCVESLRQAELLDRKLAQSVLPRLFSGFWPVVWFLILGSVLLVAIRVFIDPKLIGLKLRAETLDWVFIAGGTGAAISLLSLFFLHLIAGSGTLHLYEQLMQLSVDAAAAYQRWIVVSQREMKKSEVELSRLHEARQLKRGKAIANAEERRTARLQAADRQRDTDRQSTLADFPVRLAEIERTGLFASQQRGEQFESARRIRHERQDHDLRRLQEEFQERNSTQVKNHRQNELDLIRDWQCTLRELLQSSDSFQEAMTRNSPGWSQVVENLQQQIASSKARSSSRLSAADVDSVTATGEAFDDRLRLSLGRLIADLKDIEQGVSSDPQLAVDRTWFDLPVIVALADRPSLFVHFQEATRTAATGILQTAMLRFLTSLPAGNVRFTILDPVGLGANFASFMHLTDIDEQLVTSRIWTEAAHIETRLADLTEHMETVLQTYLRNEYSTLDDYNREAGEVAEPYRVLVVANFPAGFTEVSLRRMVSIAEGGVKCGVFMLVSFDESQPLPRGFSLSELQRHAVVLRVPPAVTAAGEKKGFHQDLLSDEIGESEAVVGRSPDRVHRITEGLQSQQAARSHIEGRGRETASQRTGMLISPFRFADPELSVWPLHMDEPPDADQFGRIVRLAGELARSVRRVEVPFERVMPQKDLYWTFSSRAGLDVPIGRAGATKLQHLRLGKGTSQHVLVAGKTGSGKSSLLHALITNAALHYSPNEVEFYLIDFKKGVEFKTYATQRLPHARVIAIESDREFGVSVLQRLDELLKDRGDLFRREGVQDLAGYRDAKPGSPMPRVMLVIDEFQEFFVEDDVLSQQANLLFDRLIRQGRAFGVHVLLGSQTLAGAYSLARSTLGQIAVRIALQCSEADAHLILSEDNTAARLLSRPGEAIYNDANGLIEGNHPFQVVWLDDSQRETSLGLVRELLNERPHASPRTLGLETVVFEGNIAADPQANPQWVEIIEAFSAPSDSSLASASSNTVSTLRCWLGESVSLTGPLDLRFGPRDGGPVMLIGRDDDAALGVLTATVLALMGQGASVNPGLPRAKFVVLDGSLLDSNANKCWLEIAKLGKGDCCQVAGPRETTAALQSVVEEIKKRANTVAEPIFVIVYDISRFRDLKKAEDDYGGYGGSDKEQVVNPSALWSEIVKDGPAAGVFPIVWCDGFQTAQRWLGRELLNRFETRILFAMNANDSSNLIDSPAASKLGPNRALLSRGDLGTIDKFRPYGVLSPERIAELTQPERRLNSVAESITYPPADDRPAIADEPAEHPPSTIALNAATSPVESSNDVSPVGWTSIDELNVL